MQRESLTYIIFLVFYYVAIIFIEFFIIVMKNCSMPSPENDRTKAKTTITDDTSADALVTQNKAQVTARTKFET